MHDKLYLAESQNCIQNRFTRVLDYYMYKTVQCCTDVHRAYTHTRTHTSASARVWCPWAKSEEENRVKSHHKHTHTYTRTQPIRSNEKICSKPIPASLSPLFGLPFARDIFFIWFDNSPFFRDANVYRKACKVFNVRLAHPSTITDNCLNIFFSLAPFFFSSLHLQKYSIRSQQAPLGYSSTISQLISYHHHKHTVNANQSIAIL